MVSGERRTYGICQRAYAAGLCGGKGGRDQLGRTHPFVVITDQDEICFADLMGDRLEQVLLDRPGHERADFVIDPDHLLRMTMLRPTDVTFFDGGGAALIDNQAFMLDT